MVEAEREGIVEPLVDRAVGRDPALAVGAPVLRGLAHGEGRTEEEGRPLGGRSTPELKVSAEGEIVQGRCIARPAFQPDPAARALRCDRVGRERIHDVEPHRGVSLDAPVDATQPMVPPAQALLKEADGGAGKADLGRLVTPGADQALARSGEVLDEVEHGAGVAIQPAAHRQHGAVDGIPVLAD